MLLHFPRTEILSTICHNTLLLDTPTLEEILLRLALMQPIPIYTHIHTDITTEHPKKLDKQIYK